MVQLLGPGPDAVGTVVVEDGVMHERGEGSGEGGLPMQGFPLGLSLSSCFLLQLCEPPLLLLDHLLTCATGRRQRQLSTLWRARGRCGQEKKTPQALLEPAG